MAGPPYQSAAPIFVPFGITLAFALGAPKTVMVRGAKSHHESVSNGTFRNAVPTKTLGRRCRWGAFGMHATATVADFGVLPMARLFYLRIAGAVALCSLTFLLVSFDPFLRAAPIGVSAADHMPTVSVNRFRKGDRLPLYRPSVGRDQQAPQTLQSQQKVPFGCDPAFSPVATPSMAKVYGRCMA